MTLIDFESGFCVKLRYASACLELERGRFRSLASLILVVNVVGELQRKRTLAASRGFLAAARLSCNSVSTKLIVVELVLSVSFCR